jgi:hypothetical protein
MISILARVFIANRFCETRKNCIANPVPDTVSKAAVVKMLSNLSRYRISIYFLLLASLVRHAGGKDGKNVVGMFVQKQGPLICMYCIPVRPEAIAMRIVKGTV